MNTLWGINVEEYFKELVNGRRTGIFDRMLLVLLRICSFPYALIMQLRALCYHAGLLRSYRLARPVVSVGNIVVGGTGKTPVAAWVAGYFMARGKKVALLTRGYGGSLEGSTAVVADGVQRLLTPAQAGDEPCLLADTLPGLIVVMGTSRHEAGLMALDKFNPDIFILDDGFQHLRLERDLDILLLDATTPLGNGLTFPAGLLREPLTALSRADVVIFTRSCDPVCPEIELPERMPVAYAVHKLKGFTRIATAALRPFAELKGLKGLAFAGIAAPAVFFDALVGEGLTIVATLSFPDHAEYGAEETAALARLRLSAKADYLITTAKDAIKLRSVLSESVPLYVAALEVEFHDASPLTAELDKFL